MNCEYRAGSPHIYSTSHVQYVRPGWQLYCEPAHVLSCLAPGKVPASRHVSAASLVALLLGSCDETALCPGITYIERSSWCDALKE
jgi:hypothetical protein